MTDLETISTYAEERVRKVEGAVELAPEFRRKIINAVLGEK